MDTSLKTAAPIRPVDVKDLGFTGISDPTLTQAVETQICVFNHLYHLFQLRIDLCMNDGLVFDTK